MIEGLFFFSYFAPARLRVWWCGGLLALGKKRSGFFEVIDNFGCELLVAQAHR